MRQPVRGPPGILAVAAQLVPATSLHDSGAGMRDLNGTVRGVVLSHRGMAGFLALALGQLSLTLACGGDGGGSSEVPGSGAPTSVAGDVSSSDGVPPEESQAPVPTAESEPEEPVVDVTVEAFDGSVTVLVRSAPLQVTVHDAEGAEVTRLMGADLESPHFGGLAMARARTFRRGTFYDPAIGEPDGRGRGYDWFTASHVTEASEGVNGEWILRLASLGIGGEEPGPEIVLRLIPGSLGVRMALSVASEPEHVLTAMSLEAAADEAFFGLGQQFDRVDNRGLIRTMMIQAEGSSESGTNEVHVPVPLLHASRGWSLFVDSRWPGAFDVAATRPDRVRTTWNVHQFEAWILVDPDPVQMVRRYTALTARPATVPYWSLGPVWWRNRNVDADEVLSDARRARESDLGGSLMWIDRPWQTYYQNFRFNPVQFPDPEAMFAELRSLGYRSLLHHSPQVNVPGTSSIAGGEDASEGLYETYVQNGWVVVDGRGDPFIFPWGGGQGAFVDWSNPAAVQAVHELIPRVADLGVVGVKMDWDEYLQPNVGPVRLDLQFHNGETNMTMKSWYSALYHKALLEGFTQAIGEPAFTLVRHGSPRDQQWSTCVWPGDLDNDFTEHTRGPSELQRQWNVGGLPAAVVANISLGLSGFPCFASDIGGYRNGQPSQENLLRWMAFGIFNGVMQLGGGGRTHMPWSEDTPYDEEALRITRRFFAERMALVPYVHEQLRRASVDGTPLIRSLWMMHPDEEAWRGFDRDFWFGPDFVVAPVFVEGATERELWLPPGEWVDWLTGERRPGGQAITRAVALDEFAAHVRVGALVPLLPPEVVSLMPAEADGVTAWEDARWMRVRAVPGASGSLRLFNGLRVEMLARQAGQALRLSVRTTDVDPDVHPEIAFPPEFVVVEVELAGTEMANGVSAVTLRRGDATVELVERPDGTPHGSGEYWWTGEEGRLLLVRLEGDAVVSIAP
ncbi:MAG: glycoside hydrolase family 31 protein [Deltaproteobacteria bacterium]|nr:MAG: glycoside hydrolase family 31 protein [Deltaproteobacteria bacterium]